MTGETPEVRSDKRKPREKKEREKKREREKKEKEKRERERLIELCLRSERVERCLPAL